MADLDLTTPADRVANGTADHSTYPMDGDG